MRRHAWWAVGSAAAIVLASVPVADAVTRAAGGAGIPVASVGDVRIWEGDTKTRTAQVPITLSEASSSPVTVSYSISAGSATAGVLKDASTGADFKAKVGTASFPAFAVVKYAPVVVYGDERDEPDETINVDITGTTNADPGDAAGLVTTLDDDPATATPVASVGDVSVTEGNSGKTRVVDFPLTLSRPATTTVSVSYTLTGVTATGGWSGSGTTPQGTDFADKLGHVQTVIFKTNAAGITPVMKQIGVRIAPDTEGEASQTFHVNLVGITAGADIGDGTGLGTIVDDDVPAEASLSVTLAGAGGGSVTSNPPGISCGATCSAIFTGGSSVTLTATPDGSSSFGGWSGACSGVGSCMVSMLGDRSVTATFVPLPPPTQWTQVGAGWDHSCGLTGGAVYCWGIGPEGQLGTGVTETYRTTPVPVFGLGSGVAEIAVGAAHSCALTTGGAVWCWGINDSGQLGDGTGTNRNAPVAVFGLASGVAHISAGYETTCAVTTAGAALCWGSGGHGEVGNGTTGGSSVPVGVSGLGTGVAQISAGHQHACAVTTAGAALCWGRDASGELGDGTTTDSSVPVGVSGLGSGVAQVSTSGLWHTCAVTTAGAALCWGDNGSGELGDGTTTDSSVPVAVSGLGAGVSQVSTGGYYEGDPFIDSCAIVAGVNAVCWGSDSRYQLGSDSGDSTTPVSVVGLDAPPVQISTSKDHSCVVTTSASAMCWGNGAFGKLGDGHGGGGSGGAVRVADVP